MKKKTTTPLSHSSDEANASLAPASTAALNLPIIKILSEEEEMFVKMDLEMEDETHDMLVKWGKEVASDEDYIGIAIRAGLEEYMDSIEES